MRVVDQPPRTSRVAWRAAAAIFAFGVVWVERGLLAAVVVLAVGTTALLVGHALHTAGAGRAARPPRLDADVAASATPAPGRRPGRAAGCVRVGRLAVVPSLLTDVATADDGRWAGPAAGDPGPDGRVA